MLERKISEAKAKLLADYPYFGLLASRLDLNPNEDIQAFLSDGERLEYNDGYLADLEMREMEFVLANGAMHAALAHERRRNGRMGWLWQLATDYAINAMLVENGMELPFGANHDDRFEGMYAEAIYAELKDEIKNEAFDDDESNDTGFNEQNRRKQNQLQQPETAQDASPDRPQQEVENDMRSQMMEQFAQQMLRKAAQRGNLPLGLERLVPIGGEPSVDWRGELYHAIDRHYKSDYRQMPPSTKLLYMDTYLPSLHSERLRLVIAIDSSGSVDEVLLQRFMAEIESIMLSFTAFEIDLLVCDAKVHSHTVFSAGEPLQYTLKGGGGTDFRPLFDYVGQQLDSCELLLYFTDLDGTMPQNEPLYEVIWVVPESCDAPFGRVVTLDAASSAS